MPQLLQSILDQVRLSTLVDIGITALLIYWLFSLIRGTRAVRLVIGVSVLFVVYAAGPVRSSCASCPRSSRPGAVVGLFALVVVFQPELRRALERIGRVGSLGLAHVAGGAPERRAASPAIVARAAVRLSADGHGALIVLERETGLEEIAETGVMIHGDLSVDLLQTIFMPRTALHDGAVIVRDETILAAGALLPLAETTIHTERFGTRHRAALGITEQTDAVVVVVSEENSQVSLVERARIVRNLSERPARPGPDRAPRPVRRPALDPRLPAGHRPRRRSVAAARLGWPISAGPSAVGPRARTGRSIARPDRPDDDSGRDAGGPGPRGDPRPLDHHPQLAPQAGRDRARRRSCTWASCSPRTPRTCAGPGPDRRAQPARPGGLILSGVQYVTSIRYFAPADVAGQVDSDVVHGLDRPREHDARTARTTSSSRSTSTAADPQIQILDWTPRQITVRLDPLDLQDRARPGRQRRRCRPGLTGRATRSSTRARSPCRAPSPRSTRSWPPSPGSGSIRAGVNVDQQVDLVAVDVRGVEVEPGHAQPVERPRDDPRRQPARRAGRCRSTRS